MLRRFQPLLTLSAKPNKQEPLRGQGKALAREVKLGGHEALHFSLGRQNDWGMELRFDPGGGWVRVRVRV